MGDRFLVNAAAEIAHIRRPPHSVIVGWWRTRGGRLAAAFTLRFTSGDG